MTVSPVVKMRAQNGTSPLASYKEIPLAPGVDSSFDLTSFLINSRKIFARKLISRKAGRATRSENT